MEDRTLLEDAVSCTSLCKNDGIVCARAVCGFKENIILISMDIVILYAAKRHVFLLFIDCILYSVTGWQDFLRAGLWRMGFCWRTWSLDERTLLECAEMYISLFI